MKKIIIILAWTAVRGKDIPLTDTGLYTCPTPMCGFCCTCVYSVTFPLRSCNPAPCSRGGTSESLGEGEWERRGSPPCLLPPLLEPGALMFQHADVGKCPAAPVVVPVSLALPLQSSGAAARRRHAAAGTGAGRAPVFEHADLQLRTVLRVVAIQEVLRKEFSECWRLGTLLLCCHVTSSFGKTGLLTRVLCFYVYNLKQLWSKSKLNVQAFTALIPVKRLKLCKNYVFKQ